MRTRSVEVSTVDWVSWAATGDWASWVAAVIVAYVLGSMPSGLLIGRLWGVNVLQGGSGRTGGTNVYRLAGPVAGLLTGALDIAKGALAVWLAGQLTGSPVIQVLAGGAVILGHNYSLFLSFRGGAGVGTSLGALAVISLPVAVLLVLLLLTVIGVTRYAAVGSLAIASMMPVILFLLGVVGVLAFAYVAYGVLAWGLIVFAHRPNISRLLSGTERRLGPWR